MTTPTPPPTRQWLAICHVLDYPSLRGRLDAFVDHDSEFINPDITSQPWSLGERVLIDIALSLSTSHHIVLCDALGALDEFSCGRVIEAIELAFGGDRQ